LKSLVDKRGGGGRGGGEKTTPASNVGQEKETEGFGGVARDSAQGERSKCLGIGKEQERNGKKGGKKSSSLEVTTTPRRGKTVREGRGGGKPAVCAVPGEKSGASYNQNDMKVGEG